MVPRFFAPHIGESDELVSLPEDESTHLARVLRLRPGDEIRVFDGRGREWRAQVANATRARAAVKLLERLRPMAEPRVAITLAAALLKGDKMDDVVRDAVMLGVSAIQPLLSDRAETRAAAVSRSRRVDRWQKIAIASAKQCGRAVVPPVEPPKTLAALLGSAPNAARVMFVEPGASVTSCRIRDLPVPTQAMLIVGPEGGWTDRELRTASEAGASLVTLGGLTLRADAMPMVALTAVKTLWEDL